jgi:hypothetical protein
MRKTLLHSAVWVILTVMIGGCLIEAVDHWDHTLRKKDADYTLIWVAVCAGCAIAVARTLSSTLKSLQSRTEFSVLREKTHSSSLHHRVAFVMGLSPPAFSSLRI